MKILLMINWRIQYGNTPAPEYLPSDYCCDDRFWFFRYFGKDTSVDVVDTRSFNWVERIEKKYLRFYVMQTLKVLPRLSHYDLIISHGTTSGILLAFLHRLLVLKMPPHIVIDISSFHRASSHGLIYRMCRYASRSIDHLIYHTSAQIDYFNMFFPWLSDKCSFIRFGTDDNYWSEKIISGGPDSGDYILCVGYRERDWDTLLSAYLTTSMRYRLVLVGNKLTGFQHEMVEALPFLPVEELTHYINKAAFCVLPLVDVPYSLGQMTLLQQMALGKAVLAADVPGIADYQSGGILRYKPQNVEDLRDKLEWLFANSEQWRQFGEKNRCVVKEQYSEQQMASEIEKVCRRVTGSNHD